MSKSKTQVKHNISKAKRQRKAEKIMTPAESCNETIKEMYQLFDMFGEMYKY